MELPASLPAPAQEVVQRATEELVTEPMPDEPVATINEAVAADASTDATESEIITESAEPSVDDVAALESAESDAGNPIGSLMQKMRHWLRRAA
jgi:hypothetical protein